MAQHCFFCGHLVGEEGCERCGTVRRARDERRVRARCPRCGSEARLVPFGLGEASLEACPRCKGMFVGAVDWDTLLDAFLQQPLPDIVVPDAEGPSAYGPYRSAPTSQMAQIDLEAPVKCPTCAETMERLEFDALSGVVIDVCAAHGVWLDAGELERLVESTHPHPALERVAYRVPPPFTPLTPLPLTSSSRAAPPEDAPRSRIAPESATRVEQIENLRRAPEPVFTLNQERDDRWTVRLGRALGHLVSMIVSRKDGS